MRSLSELDITILLNWLALQTMKDPNKTISISSPSYGPLCGFVPNNSTSTTRYELDDSWFDSYKLIDNPTKPQ